MGSNGGTFANAATNYYQNETNTLKTAENVAQVFMGMRIQCAQCHNHPFDRWTMDDYYSFSAFFSQIGRKRGEDPRELIIFNSGSGEVKHPVGGRVMPPKFLGGEVPDVKGKDRRVVMANWLASRPRTLISPRTWPTSSGPTSSARGSSTKSTTSALATRRSTRNCWTRSARNSPSTTTTSRSSFRDICMSRTYQLSTQTNETNVSDGTNFSHGALRRLRAEVMLDCISQATDTKNKFRGLPLGARAVQISDGNTSTYFLKTFGRASRGTVCSCEVKMEPNLSQALHMLNGDTVNSKIKQGKLVETRVGEGKTPHEIIDEIYIRCLSRKPTEKEVAALGQTLEGQEDPKPVLEDIFWAVLNSREFLFNH